MTLMRFDPFRELDRLSEQTVRTPRALPLDLSSKLRKIEISEQTTVDA